MKKNTMMRIAAVVLMCALVTACFASSTFAKYTSEAAVESNTARVAKWDIELGDDPIWEAETTFDLFDTVYTNVVSADDDYVIAPGTEGNFEFALSNDSEVDATCAIAFTATKTANIPIQFSLNGTDWEDDISALDDDDFALAIGAEETFTVYWQWIYEVDDTQDIADTDLGKVGTDTVVVTVDITATQDEPVKA